MRERAGGARGPDGSDQSRDVCLGNCIFIALLKTLDTTQHKQLLQAQLPPVVSRQTINTVPVSQNEKYFKEQRLTLQPGEPKGTFQTSISEYLTYSKVLNVFMCDFMEFGATVYYVRLPKC